MTIRIEPLNGGYELITERDWNNCKKCKEKVNEYDFFWCDEQDVFLCRDCGENPEKHKNIRGTWNKPHTDWHIVKVTKPEDYEEQEVQEYEGTD